MEIYESPAPLENEKKKISGEKPDSRIKISEHTSSVCTFFTPSHSSSHQNAEKGKGKKRKHRNCY